MQRVFLIQFVLIAIIGALPAYSATESWESLYKQAHEDYRDGKVAEAERILRLALTAVGQGSDAFREKANTLDAIALICQSDGRKAEARELLEQALTLRQKNLWPSHPKIVDDEHRLAALYEEAGDLSKAEGLYRQELAERERVLRGKHPKILALQDKIAHLSLALGKTAEAKHDDNKAEEFYKLAADDLSNDRAARREALTHLAYLYAAKWQFDAAHECMTQVIDLWTKDYGKTGLPVADALLVTAEFLRNDGVANANKQKLIEAESIAQRSLEIKRQNHLAANHPQMVANMKVLAELHRAIARIQ